MDDSVNTVNELIDDEDYVWSIHIDDYVIQGKLSNSKWEEYFTVDITDTNQYDFIIPQYSFIIPITTLSPSIVIENDSTVRLRDADTIRCITVVGTHTLFIYCVVGDDEYLIPYGSRPDITELENGHPYSIHEVRQKVADVFAYDSENLNTTTGSTVSTNTNNTTKSINVDLQNNNYPKIIYENGC